MIELSLWVFGSIAALFVLVVLRGAPYVPSRRRDIDVAFKDLYRLSKDDLLVDIGSGDGVVLRAASKCGARAVGYEINPVLAIISRLLNGGNSRIKVMFRDFWLTPLPSEVTVVYVFSESRDIGKMAKRVQNEASRLKKTIWLISYAFEVPGMMCHRKNDLYFLYKLQPLQFSRP